MDPAKPVRIAHVLLTLRTGGLERVAVDLTNCAHAPFEPFFVCLETSGPMAAEIRRPATPVLELKRPAGFRPWLALPLARVLRQRGAALVHTHNSAAGFYGALAGRLAGRPVVHTKHGQNLSGGRQRAVNRLAYKATDHIVAVSEPARALALSEGANPARLTIIDNGVDTGRFADRTSRRAQTRSALGLGDGDLVVGTLARLYAVKNQRLLIDGAAGAAESLGRSLTLVLVGDGPEREPLESHARSRSGRLRVVFAGVGRAEDWLPAFDLFAMSSDSEGLPVALLEAMACGLPAVVTAVGAMPEVVDHGGAGVIVPPKDRAALAAAVAGLAADSEARTRLGEAALRRATERYSADRMAREYEELYRRLLA